MERSGTLNPETLSRLEEVGEPLNDADVQCCVACDEPRGMLIIVRDPGKDFDPAWVGAALRDREPGNPLRPTLKNRAIAG